MKKWDFAVIAFVALVSLLPLAFLTRGGARSVTVTQRGDVLYSGPLERDAVIEAEGGTIVVENGRARMAEANCPDGLCLAAGAAGPSRPVICLPNEIVISVTDAEEGIDGLAY
ncbi:MAG: NusG domain II-containing protein [Clostridia bacterium]|nr:NusG domain II-containing protein [Clostridia bacterium]